MRVSVNPIVGFESTYATGSASTEPFVPTKKHILVTIPGTDESARATAIAAAKDAVILAAESHIGCDGDSETFAQLAKAVRDLQALATLAAAEKGSAE